MFDDEVLYTPNPRTPARKWSWPDSAIANGRESAGDAYARLLRGRGCKLTNLIVVDRWTDLRAEAVIDSKLISFYVREPIPEMILPCPPAYYSHDQVQFFRYELKWRGFLPWPIPVCGQIVKALLLLFQARCAPPELLDGTQLPKSYFEDLDDWYSGLTPLINPYPVEIR